MPTYEYKCEACGYDFQKFQNITEDPVKKCPECGGRVKRLVSSGAGIIFKGNGFYQTDYKNSGSKSEKKPAECGKSDACSSCPAAKK